MLLIDFIYIWIFSQVIYVNQTMAVMTVSYNDGYLACSYGEFLCVYKIGKYVKDFIWIETRLIECKYQVPGMFSSKGRRQTEAEPYFLMYDINNLKIN